MSQPPYYPSSGPQGGAYAPPAPQPVAPPAAGAPQAAPQPAAPTQIAYPGQLLQPQYSPPPQPGPVQSGPFATGFPNYRPPAPSPRNLTGLIVGIIACLVVIIFAVLGFWLVS